MRSLHRLSRLVSVCYEPEILEPVARDVGVRPVRMRANRFTRIVVCDDAASRARIVSLRGVAWRSLPEQIEKAAGEGRRGRGAASIFSEMSPDSPWLGWMLAQAWPELYKELLPDIDSLPPAGHSLGGTLALFIAMLLRVRRPEIAASRLHVDAFGSFPAAQHGAGPGRSYLEPFGLPTEQVRWTVLGLDVVPRSYTPNDPGYSFARSILPEGALRLRERVASLAGGVLSRERFLYEAPGVLFHLRPIHSALAASSGAGEWGEHVHQPGAPREEGGGAHSRRLYEVRVARGHAEATALLRIDPDALRRDPVAPLRDHLHRQYEGALASVALALPRPRFLQEPPRPAPEPPPPPPPLPAPFPTCIRK
eukprot:tig00001657_g9545.t1